METGIYGAAPQWARISVIMVVASWHDALAADQLPREIVGNWCVAIEQMLREQKYPYRRCKDSNWDIIVRWDGFDAQETSCELNTIKRQGAAWLASFGCSGAGLTRLEDDEIRVGKDGAGGQDQERTSRWRSYSLLLEQQMLKTSCCLTSRGGRPRLF